VYVPSCVWWSVFCFFILKSVVMLHKGGNYFYVLRNVLYFELRTENIAVKTHGLIAIYIVHSVPTKLQFQEISIKLCFFFFF